MTLWPCGKKKKTPVFQIVLQELGLPGGGSKDSQKKKIGKKGKRKSGKKVVRNRKRKKKIGGK